MQKIPWLPKKFPRVKMCLFLAKYVGLDIDDNRSTAARGHDMCISRILGHFKKSPGSPKNSLGPTSLFLAKYDGTYAIGGPQGVPNDPPSGAM